MEVYAIKVTLLGTSPPHLFLARLAPGSPKIDEHYFAAKVGGRNLVTLQIRHGEVGQARTDLACGRSSFFWLRGTHRAGIASGKSGRSEAQHQQKFS